MKEKEATEMEINREIALFLGYELCGFKAFAASAHSVEYHNRETGRTIVTPRYTRSIDSIIPAAKKLGITQIKIGDSYGFEQCSLVKYTEPEIYASAETEQMAAAAAVCKAIRAMPGYKGERE